MPVNKPPSIHTTCQPTMGILKLKKTTTTIWPSSSPLPTKLWWRICRGYLIFIRSLLYCSICLHSRSKVQIRKRKVHIDATASCLGFMRRYTDVEGGSTSIDQDGEADQLLYSQLHGGLKVLYDLINPKLDRNFERLGAKMDNVLALVKEIKQGVRSVMRGLQQVEVNIVAKCSTGILKQLLVQGVIPAYSYLTNSEGKMQRLKEFLRGRKEIVHFLCESLTEGPHIVEGQAGREVVVEKGFLRKWAPFLVPSLMVLCCAASFAANAYLPGIAPLFFNPLLDCLKSIGITHEDLKSQIMPRALDALFEGIGVKIQELYDQKKAPFISINEGQRKEGVEALQKILGSIADLDVERDFGLCLVQVSQTRAQWLCKEHATAHHKLKHPPNPFQHIAQ